MIVLSALANSSLATRWPLYLLSWMVAGSQGLSAGAWSLSEGSFFAFLLGPRTHVVGYGATACIQIDRLGVIDCQALCRCLTFNHSIHTRTINLLAAMDLALIDEALGEMHNEQVAIAKKAENNRRKRIDSGMPRTSSRSLSMRFYMFLSHRW